MPDAPPNRPPWLIAILESDGALQIFFWAYCVPILIAALGLLRRVGEDAFHDFGVLATVVAGMVAAALALLTLKGLGVDRPLIGGVRRMKVYVCGAFGSALALASFLSIMNYKGTLARRRALPDDRIAREER